MGCQDNKEISSDININPEVERTKTSKPDVAPAEAVNVKATTHIYPKELMIAASVAPKSGMRAFSSKILLLSESGKVYSATTAFPQLELAHDGPFTEISGFYLSDNRSGFFAVGNKELEAFIENESGGFEPQALLGIEAANSLCEDVVKTPGQITLSEAGALTRYDITVEGSELNLVATDGADLTCGSGQTFLLAHAQPKAGMLENKTKADVADIIANSPVVSMSLNPGLLLEMTDERRAINIIDGLSIDGIANPQWIYSTSQALGNTFNQGVTLVRGDDANRVVMISNEYLGKTVFGAMSAPEISEEE